MASDDATTRNDEMFSVAYDELRRLARSLRQRSKPETLNTTALVHEAYIKLSRSSRYRAESPQHLKYTVVRAMKQILLDAARRRSAVVHGGGAVPVRQVPLDDPSAEVAALDPAHLLSVGFALESLAQRDELQARVFELQFFGGFQVAEIAQTIGSSEKRVQRLLRMAKASLAVALAAGGAAGGGGGTAVGR
jgi:RNA polymerase sigma factor (TIGR02999 family)